MEKTEAWEMLSVIYGEDVSLRVEKLKEEYKEFIEAFNDKKDITKAEWKDNVLDELADMNVIIYHIAHIMGVTQDELLKSAMDKITGRITNPNYRRKHPHGKARCCGNCKEFMNEWPNGEGICNQAGEIVKKDDKPCNGWEKGKNYGR